MSFLVHDMVGWAPSIESILVSARSMNSAGHLEGTSAQQGLVAGSGMSVHSTTIGEDQLIALSQRAPSEGQSICLSVPPSLFLFSSLWGLEQHYFIIMFYFQAYLILSYRIVSCTQVVNI